MLFDKTQDPALASWVSSANGNADFPIQNLPIGVFTSGSEGTANRYRHRRCPEKGLLKGEALRAAEVASGGELNAFFALGAPARKTLEPV